MKNTFSKIATKTSEAIGSLWAFIIALGVILVWLASGPILKFSDTWQLVINTSTTIITFLTVFLIQYTQNKSARATQLKLDEIIHAITTARNDFIELEDISDEKLQKLRIEYKKMKEPIRIRKRKTTTRKSSR